MHRNLARLVVAGSALAAAACGGPSSPDEGAARPAAPTKDASSPAVDAHAEGRTVKTTTPVKGSQTADFAADAVYLGEGGSVAGVRWVHRTNRMPVTVLRIQSVPQVFLAFHTPPVSDRGEPHTGEHLLLGKGTKGKMLSLEQDMSLIESTAWTSQADVCYSWSCSAGKATFYRSVEQYLDALLFPDFTDEEIRREVCHVGPVVDEATGKLTVDEKGTIYQEMVSTYEKRWNAWYETQKRVWGEGHPLAASAGGEPSAVRTVEPHHVREFHAAHYHLGPDTEMIVALPDSVPEAEFLDRLSKQMAAVNATPELKARPKEPQAIPPARPDADRSVRLVPYPNANEGDTGTAILAWPAVPLGAQEDRVVAEVLLATLGNGESATLYKRLMDSSTREVEVDAADLSAGLETTKVDLMPFVSLDGLPPRNANAAKLAEIVRVVHAEVRRVADLAVGSAALKAFNEKALAKLAEREKDLKRQLNSPPLFGHRNAGGFWLEHLRRLDRDPSFERSVTLEPVFTKIRADLEKGVNPWTKAVGEFGLDGEPFVTASVASRAELDRRTAEKAARIEGYVADLTKRYGGTAQEALAKFDAEYRKNTAELDAIEKRLGRPKLVDDVPLVPDPSLKLEPVKSAGVKGFRGVFDNMTFAETSLYLRLDAVPDDLSPWLAVLPSLLVGSGVVEDGRVVPYDKADERRSREIYSLSIDYAMRPSRGRHELRLTAEGADLAEARRAIQWIGLSLQHARLDVDNVERLRDLVARAIRDTRGRLGGSEESWVHDPSTAIRWQRDRLYLSSSSIHARLFHLARCEWRLMGVPVGHDLDQVKQSLDAMALAGGLDAPTTLSRLDALLATLDRREDAAAKNWIIPVVRRCREMVGDMAPSTIVADLKTLAEVAAFDLATPPEQAVAEIREVRDVLLAKPSARFVLTGSRANTDALLPRLAELFDGFAELAPKAVTRSSAPLVNTRLADHEPAGTPVHYGLVHQAGTSGVFLHSAKAAGLDELDDVTLTMELAGRVFGGSGAHALFMKTWGAGLAYSNGLSVNPFDGRVSYYAERCPDLVQTMSFVTGLVRDSESLDDPWLAEYCVANAVAYSRAGDEYEQRTRAAADEMVDGDTPGRVAKYRGAVLALRGRPALWKALKPHVVAAASRVIPGVAGPSREVAGGVFVTIAPEPMLDRWEKYLQGHEGEDEHVRRVYGRDFWIVPR